MKIYTKKGDKCETNLFGTNKKISKASKRVKSYGEIDELNSFIGLTISKKELSTDFKKHFINIEKELQKIQNDLFIIGSNLATTKKSKEIKKISKNDINRLEKLLDKYSKESDPLKNFILPGGSTLASLFHICRAICRRAERKIVELSEMEEINNNIIPYLNRLSDLFFTLARVANKILNIEDTKWKQ